MIKYFTEMPVESKRKIAARTAIVSGLFLLLLSVLMILNFAQNRLVDPLDSPALKTLMAELNEDPENKGLRDQIRALDLLARKAYFTHMWQLRTGSFLLFVFVLIFLVSLKYIQAQVQSLPDLSEQPENNQLWSQRMLSRQWLFYSGAGLFVIVFLLVLFSENNLSAGNDQPAAGPTIEEIRENWPNFRGPHGNGNVYQTDSEFPVFWNVEAGENVLWESEVPLPGFSSPIVWGNRLFLSGADKNTQQIYCWDTESGALLWTGDGDGIPGSPDKAPNVTDDTGYAAATMATDGNRVFAVYATGDIAAWDFEGKRLWAKNLGVPDNHYGHSSSLMVYQDRLLVQYDQNTGGRILALNVENGNVIFDKQRDVKISWASSIVVNTGSRDEWILNAEPFVMSFNPINGNELWRLDCMMGEIAPSPVYADGVVFAVNEYARLAAIDPQNPEELLWEYDDYLAEVSSPVATADFVLSATSYGSVGCFDAKSGEMIWENDFDEGFYSSPILLGNTVYLMNMHGIMYVFEAFPELKMISENPLGSEGLTTPAFKDGRIYIRGPENLICIEK